MHDAEAVRACVSQMARASRGAPVTVKCRCLKGLQLKGLQLLVYEVFTHRFLKGLVGALRANKCRCLKGLQLLVYEVLTHEALQKCWCLKRLVGALRANKCRCLKGLQLLVYETLTHDEALTLLKAA